MLEIEIKVKVTDIGAVRSQILRIGGMLSETLTEHDTYYNAPHRDFGVTDEALRLRQTGFTSTVTYKGPKNTILGSKIREEHNLVIPDPDEFHKIITSLGFIPVAVVRKRREYYRCNDFTISLDQVEGLGEYVEIELITENSTDKAAVRVDRLAKKIGVTGERITASYLELLLSTR
jgi:adenylate cyclase class 2